MFKTKYEALVEERKELYLKIKNLEDDFLKRGHTDQTIFMNKPKEFKFYNPREGIGYDNPRRLAKAIDEFPELYDMNYMGYGVTEKFVYDCDEVLDNEDFEKQKEKYSSFTCDYETLNENHLTSAQVLSDDYFRSYTPTELNANNPIQQVAFKKLYVPNSVLQRKIQDLEQTLSKQKVEFRSKEKVFESKIAQLESSLSTTSSDVSVSMNTSSFSEVDFDAYMNSEIDSCEKAPKTASGISHIPVEHVLNDRSSRTRPKRSRKRKARSKTTTSKEQKVEFLFPSSITNLSSTFKTGLTNDVKKIWRPKVLNDVSKGSSMSTEPVNRFVWKPKTVLSTSSKLCYSFNDLLVCNKFTSLDNVVFVNDVSIKSLLNVSNSMFGCVSSTYSPASIHKFLSKGVSSKGPIFKWVPKRT
jgi:hypothetical protein